MDHYYSLGTLFSTGEVLCEKGIWSLNLEITEVNQVFQVLKNSEPLV